MFRLCLVRHAKAEQTDAIPDDDRDLTRRGLQHAEVLGTVLAARSPAAGLIVASPILRARRTAEVISLRAGSRLIMDDRLSTRAGVEDALAAIAQHFPQAASGRLVVVGHNPTFSELAGRLTLSGHAGMRTCECLELEFDDGRFPGIARSCRTLYAPGD